LCSSVSTPELIINWYCSSENRNGCANPEKGIVAVGREAVALINNA